MIFRPNSATITSSQAAAMNYNEYPVKVTE